MHTSTTTPTRKKQTTRCVFLFECQRAGPVGSPGPTLGPMSEPRDPGASLSDQNFSNCGSNKLWIKQPNTGHCDQTRVVETKLQKTRVMRTRLRAPIPCSRDSEIDHFPIQINNLPISPTICMSRGTERARTHSQEFQFLGTLPRSFHCVGKQIPTGPVKIKCVSEQVFLTNASEKRGIFTRTLIPPDQLLDANFIHSHKGVCVWQDRTTTPRPHTTTLSRKKLNVA